MKNPVFALFFVTLHFYACGPDYFFQEEKKIAHQQWTYRDTLDFNFSVSDTVARYNLYVDFSYADSFPNQNLYVKFYTRFPDGKRLSKPLSFDLFDAQGIPAGECSGHICRAHIAIQQNAFFNRQGNYTITMEQFGRREPLPGLHAVGISIEKTGKKK